MFKEIVDDAGLTTDIGRSQKLTMSTSCSGELKIRHLPKIGQNLMPADRAKTICPYLSVSRHKNILMVPFSCCIGSPSWLSLSQMTNFRLFQTELNLKKMAESSPNE